MKANLVLAQIPLSDSISENVDSILSGLTVVQPGDIVVFPEAAVSGYSKDPSFLANIKNDELEAALDELRHQAQQQQIHLWAGSYHKDGSQWFNTALGFTPNGGAYQYRKINLAKHEQGVISPGSDLALFELELAGGTLTVGVQICGELRFPEQWGWLARQGAQVILHLNHAVGDSRVQPVWRSHLISHAAANQRYIFSVNHADTQQNCPTMAVSPEGWVLEEIVSNRPVFRRVEIDLRRVLNEYLGQSRRDVVRLGVPEKKERRRILRSMKLNQLHDDLEEILNNPDLFQETNLSARTEAFEFIRLLEDMYALRPRERRLEDLYRQGMALRRRLEEINSTVFSRLRERIKLRQINDQQLRDIFYRYTDYRTANPGKAHYGYENLDSLISGVFFNRPKPEETLERKPGMIRYQPTPASVILEMVDQVSFQPGDVFYDLGSGLGQVVGLVHVMTGIRCVGVEYQPSYAQFSRLITRDLRLSRVEFITNDVMEVDLSEGDVFFLFNPFGGQIFDVVMANLRLLARKKAITVCSYGTCTEQIVQQPWLQIEDPETVHEFKLAIFRSKGGIETAT